VLGWCVIRGFIYLRGVAGSLTFRTATLSDVDALARAVAEGLEGYRAFAPDGWAPQPAQEEAGHLRALLADERVWCRLAEDERGLAGQVTVLPASSAARPLDDPAVGHLRNLFVRRDRWGSGLAKALHAAALEAARERRYREMRLFSAAAQARARRFYEREGWALVGEPAHVPRVGLVMVEYRRTL
jgi:GNAT superfamily N-acetyltransferase